MPLSKKSVIITKDSIVCFQRPSSKSKNDSYNNVREEIIASIINKQINDDYYSDDRWSNLKDAIHEYIQLLCTTFNITHIHTIDCKRAGGRGKHHDFNLTINDEIYKIEFKYNAEKINDAPQFVSPAKPSQYLEDNFEEFYHPHLKRVSEGTNLKIPDLAVYLKEIHTDKPNCMLDFQTKYYKGCSKSSRYSGEQSDIDFYKKAIEISKETIQDFIGKTDLNMVQLTEYLLETQKNKLYMMYKNGKFHLQKINIDNYIIESFTKKLNCYIAITKSGIKLKILLRWKNGNGIAYPAFQIS